MPKGAFSITLYFTGGPTISQGGKSNDCVFLSLYNLVIIEIYRYEKISKTSG